ncbi:hypothetical protein BJY01DRAFT_262076 [Aspergillus pseudoustus]|uniref:Uncharacterized protein n=1 Tax=Aspergillus pseudoustus TaxID=1810923 RepID=A0ABR4IKF4_9EURO
MYPWREKLASWARDTGLHIDALGLVTLLGADEMNRSIGRLMPSAYLDYLPLLGAHIVAGNRFVEKTPGFILYNLSAGLTTTEVAGWFSRWLHAQDFKQVRSKVNWRVLNDGDDDYDDDNDNDNARRWMTYFVPASLVALPVHALLISLTVLTSDWWGFTNAVSMIVSVMVRCWLVAQNQAGIDANIEQAEEDARKEAKKKAANIQPKQRSEIEIDRDDVDVTSLPLRPTDDPQAEAKDDDDNNVTVLVITDDSKVVTICAPGHVVKAAFTTSPRIQRPAVYLACRAIGWIAFGVHVISIGMAALYTQICSVALIIIASVLTAYRVGSEDSRLAHTIRNNNLFRGTRRGNEEGGWPCRVTLRLRATVSTYPAEYTEWEPVHKEGMDTGMAKVVVTKQEPLLSPLEPSSREGAMGDLEKSVVASTEKTRLSDPPEHRRDFYV